MATVKCVEILLPLPPKRYLLELDEKEAVTIMSLCGNCKYTMAGVDSIYQGLKKLGVKTQAISFLSNIIQFKD